jgi:uncharacterized protein (TIGR03067 family)
MSLLLAAGLPPEEGGKKDLEKLQGTWRVIIFEVEGKRPAEDTRVKGSYVFAGDRLLIRKIDDAAQQARFRLDPGKTPKEMDVLIVDGSDKQEKLEWIYQLNDDELRVAGNHPGKGRPTGFDPQGAFFVLVLKRDKS